MISWDNRLEETIQYCEDLGRYFFVGLITSLPKQPFSLTVGNHFSYLSLVEEQPIQGFCLHRNNPSYFWRLPCLGCRNALAGHSQSTYDYKTDNVEGFIIAIYYNDLFIYLFIKTYL